MAQPMSAHDTRHVIAALDALDDGNESAYRWSLWIGLGDGWCPFHARLMKDQAISRGRVGGGGKELVLTERGQRLKARLAAIWDARGAKEPVAAARLTRQAV